MQFVVQASVIVATGGAILLVQEGKEAVRGLWNLPGGHVQPGEDIAMAAVREVYEETGVEARIHGLVGIYTGIGRDHYLHFVYAGTTDAGLPRPSPPEIIDCRWYTPNELQMLEDACLLNPHKLRLILIHYTEGRHYPPTIVSAPL